MDSGLAPSGAPRNDREGEALLTYDGGQSGAGNRAAFSSSGSRSPFARYDTVR
ncbi:GTPase involved in cell partitioning and DNA repair [Bradyrhizobium betae]|nr:GTPase involved in cell partitioning and DNA repair [Bradyrhizobium betae]